MSFCEAAHTFLDCSPLVRWRRLGDGVDYYYCEAGLYIVRSFDNRHPASPPSYTFVNAKSVAELRTQYYGEYYD